MGDGGWTGEPVFIATTHMRPKGHRYRYKEVTADDRFFLARLSAARPISVVREAAPSRTRAIAPCLFQGLRGLLLQERDSPSHFQPEPS